MSSAPPHSDPFADRRHALWLALVVCLANGLLLLNDWFYWDGYLIASGRAEPQLLWHMFVDAGAVIGYPIHHGLLQLPGFPVPHKLTSLLAALVIAFASRQLARRSGYLSAFESTVVGGIAGTWPALLVDVELVMVPYPVCFAMFLVGWAVFTYAPRPSLPARAFALLCLFPSFSIRSLLVLHLAFCALLVLSRASDAEGDDVPLARRVAVQALRHADLFVIPFLYWGANEAFFPRRKEYADYNQLKLSPATILRAVVSFFLTTFARWPLAAVKSVVKDPVALVVATVVGATGIWTLRPSADEASPRPRTAARVLLVGGWLLIAGIFPYAAIGAAPAPQGWGRRHGLLTGLGTAIIVLGLVDLLRARIAPRIGKHLWVLPVLCIAASAGGLVDGLLGWQARAAKDRAIVLHLRASEEARRASVLWIDDRFPRGEEKDYRFYEWASMGELAWGDERHVGFDRGTPPEVVREKSVSLTHVYNAADVDLQGCAALISLAAAGPPESDWRLGARYTLARIAGAGTVPDAWLLGVLTLRAEPLPSADGKNCRREPAAALP